MITDRFVVPLDAHGQPLTVRHGVDLSGYNTGIDYKRLAACGATFAFVRLERPLAGGGTRRPAAAPYFAQHAAGLRDAGIGVIATYDFQRDARFKQVETYLPFKGNLDALEASSLMADARSHGRALAQQFLALLTSLNMPDGGTFAFGPGDAYRLFAVDVEEVNDKINAAGLQNEFGMIYAATIASFAIEVQKANHNLVPVLYTGLNTYSTYLANKISRQDDLALASYPAWVVRVLPDGRDAYPPRSKAKMDMVAQRFCIVAGGDRCLFQQYSHRALIGYGITLPYGGTSIPKHHDIDRMFAVKACSLGMSSVLVRDDADRSRCD